ncbi:MAG: zinc carboxypeptidase, partial [Dinghuibacter sp.]|nr:zinc carboxypeptidase [Dinghuibacter sp.]
LVQAFKKFFDDSRNALGSEYKTYILTSDDEGKINGLKKLLIQNGIEVTKLNGPVAGTGFRYSTGKPENIVLEKYSYAVSAYQPRSVLARVLLEPRAKLVDSATYDITAWSLPYAHGVNAYATALRVNGVPDNDISEIPAVVPNTDYALFVPYTSIADAKLLSALLKKGVRIRMNDKPITYRKQRFDRGTLLILKKENAAKWNEIEKMVAASGSKAQVVEGGFMDSGPDMGSPDVKMVHAPRVGMLTGNEANSNAVGEIWHLFDRQLNYPISLFHASEFNARMLRNLDVLVLADGFYKFANDKNLLDEVKNWVRNGGRIVAIEYAAQQLAGLDWGVKLKKADDDAKDDKKDIYADIRRFENRERDELVNYIPGAIYRVQLDESHPLAYGYGKEYFSLKQNSEVLEFVKEGGWNVGIVKPGAKLTGFAGAKANNKIKDGTVLAVQDMGRGAVTYIIDNTMFRSFWENGKLLFFNAVFLVGNNPIRL